LRAGRGTARPDGGASATSSPTWRANPNDRGRAPDFERVTIRFIPEVGARDTPAVTGGR